MFKPYFLISSIFIFIGFFILKNTLIANTNNICANTLSCKDSLELSINNNEQGIFEGVAILPPKVDLEENQSQVLGIESDKSIEKKIKVDLTNQKLFAYDGDTLYMEATISSGKWFPTPTGEFKIWRKVRSTKMSGGEGADYYYLPNVPYVMFFYNEKIAAGRGFALHGAYWHNNFGHAMSHGCVNMKTRDAEKLYNWAFPVVPDGKLVSNPGEEGTKIIIYGKAP